MKTGIKVGLWAVLIAATLYGLNRYDLHRRRAVIAAVLMDIQTGRIADSATFARHCGQPDHISYVGNDMEMEYLDVGITVSLVRIHPDDKTDLSSHISFRGFRTSRSIDPVEAITELQCKAT